MSDKANMEDKNILKRQHGLFVSICFVVGFIVGTGVFFIPGRVLFEAGGDIRLGILAWTIGGLMIAPCVFMFSIMAGKYEKIHGFVDYSEAIVGRKYGYLAGWFFAVMYQPAGYAIISWISSGFTATLAGLESSSSVYLPFRFFISAFFMVMAFAMNYLAPGIPVKFNVTTTIARMIPLVLMGTAGIAIGLIVNRGSPSSLATSLAPASLAPGIPASSVSGFAGASLFTAISSTAFAFNGWQAALAFNSEVKNSKRNFPIALMTGFGLIIVVYVLYFIGIVIASPDGGAVIMQGGGDNFAQGTYNAFSNVFGAIAGRILIGFMLISGLGILNACCLGMSRAMYSLGRRNLGPMPHRMTQLDPITNVPNNSMVMAVGISFIWLFVVFANTLWFESWFGSFRFTLPDFYNYSFFTLLIPLFAGFIIRQKDIHWVKRFVIPVIAICGSGFMFLTYWMGSPVHGLVYSCTFIFLALVGFSFFLKRKPE